VGAAAIIMLVIILAIVARQKEKPA